MKINETLKASAAKFAALLFSFGLAAGAWGAAKEVGTWAELWQAANFTGEIVLTNDIEADGDWGSKELYNDQTLELDLAGYSISVPSDWGDQGLITVDEGSSLTIKGSGMIDASLVEDEYFQAVNNSGSLTIKTGVTIKVDKSVNATALNCEDVGTTTVEDGVVLEGCVYPEGFTFAADEKTVSGKHTVSGGHVVVESSASEPGSVVAKIGDTEYTSLVAAISDVPANGTETTIVMQADTVLDAMVTIAAGKNVKLDLNGRSITTATQSNGNHYYAFDNCGTFVVMDLWCLTVLLLLWCLAVRPPEMKNASLPVAPRAACRFLPMVIVTCNLLPLNSLPHSALISRATLAAACFVAASAPR